MSDGVPTQADASGLRSAGVRALAETLRGLDADVHDAERIDQLAALETLARRTRAAQARGASALYDSQVGEQATAGIPQEHLGAGVASQVALARRISPTRGATLLGVGRSLCRDMPHTLAALDEGLISEWAAIGVVHETATLSAAHRSIVDEDLVGQFSHLSEQALRACARALGYRLDPESQVRRIAKARKERCVTARPAPDIMSHLTARLPAEDVVAVMAALNANAASARAAGDPRTSGQVMADALVEKITGHRASQHDAYRPAPNTPFPDTDASERTAGEGESPAARGAASDGLPEHDEAEPASAGQQSRPPIELQLVMSDTALFNGGSTPALLNDEPLPAWLARDLVTDPDTKVRLRCLYTNKIGQVVARESRSRTFTGGLRDLVKARDQRCRTPGCGAPIRHIDHVTGYANGYANGAQTSYDEGQGYCERCNYAKQAPGWSAKLQPNPDDPDKSPPDVVTITPTGHSYLSRAPILLPPEEPPPYSGARS